MHSIWFRRIAVPLIAAVALTGCGDGDGDGDATATTASESTATTAARGGPKHPCELLTLAEVNRMTGLAHTETEREDADPGSTFNSSSCTYSLKEPPGRGSKSASVLLSISRPSGSRSLDHTGPGSFLAGPNAKPIEGIAGASDTGADYGEAAARFGDDRIVFVRVEANAPVTDSGYDRTAKAVELLKALLSKGA